MKFGGDFITGRNQLQWVVLLLAAAVVLPTVSLLWFMSRVVANERLVIREKLVLLYQDKLLEAVAKTEDIYAETLSSIDKIKPTGNPYSIFTQLVLNHNFGGLVLLDTTGNVVYPASIDVVSDDFKPDDPLANARQFEFNSRMYEQATQLYDGFSSDSNPHVAIAAIMGEGRCLSRLGRFDEAIEYCSKAAFISVENLDHSLRLAVENARLLLLSLIEQTEQPGKYSEIFNRTVNLLLADLFNPEGDSAFLPANQNLFVARKTLEVLEKESSLDIKIVAEKDKLARLVEAEELSISVSENSSLVRALAVRPTDTIFRAGAAYGLCHQAQSETLLVLLSNSGIESLLAAYRDLFAGEEPSYRIVDASGDFVAGVQQPDSKPFVTAPLSTNLPGWTVEMYFEGGEVFDKAASRQIAIYVWTGILVISLILVAGGFAVRGVNRQIRLNKMKNDFIATVSHELKTPLASMRVLVDTLLEGNIKDQSQAEEYLSMTSRENERLSRMIDNFLSFSRMERNKKVFTMVDTKPADIARDSVEAVKAKFTTNNCKFGIDVADNLPEIQADHDAMVTVLVNLLDNACKYTGDDKHITLKVLTDDGNVCFLVDDNGLGLSRRHIRRIFESFYQVDNSLSRKAEGCGLGLSIAKFIVDAHKGTISVESRPGHGSTFKVKIPVLPKQAD